MTILELEILIPEQMLQRLQIALAQIKPDNTSKNLLHKIYQIIYSLYQSQEISKKVYHIKKINTDLIQNGYHIYEFKKKYNT